MVPPGTSTIARQIASPSPTPGTADSLFPRANLSNIVCSWPGGRPGPLSQTSSCRFSPSTWASIPISACAPAYFTAFSSRLISTRSKSGPSTWIKVSGSGRERLMGDDKPGSSICSALPTTSSSVNHSFFKFAPYPVDYSPVGSCSAHAGESRWPGGRGAILRLPDRALRFLPDRTAP